MYDDYLIKAGLTPEEATVYQICLKEGTQTARKIQQKSPYKRGLIYKILDGLIEKKLILKKDEKGKVSVFSPLHPKNLKELAEKREREARDVQATLSGILPALVSDFNLASGTPGISFYEGVGGVEKIYDDIIATKKDIMLFRSIYDNRSPELSKLVYRQIDRQIKKGINALVLGPMTKSVVEKIKGKDKENLVTRRIMPIEKFQLDSQIIIYGDKVAIIAVKDDPIITTLVDNPGISQTFRTLFQYIWTKSEKDHIDILKNLSKQD